MRRVAYGLLAGVLGSVSCFGVAAQHVERRGGEPPLQGEVTEVSDAGVTVRSDLGATHFVPWDRVRRVASRAFESDIERYRETSIMLWRARSRIERNDAALAEPLFERLFETYRGRTHETALVVAEGLLRCRLARGEQTLALIPALETARLRRAGVETVSYNSLPEIMNDAAALCEVLPPLWAESRLLERLYRELGEYRAQDDEVIDAIARLYRESIRRVLEVDDESRLTASAASSLPEHNGVDLLRGILAIREQSRTKFLAAPDRLSGFAHAWMRFFVGKSLLAESGVVRKQRGMMNMLYVPARFGDSQKLLAGAALQIVSSALESSGQVEEAARLRHELATRYPYHPMDPLAGAVADPGS